MLPNNFTSRLYNNKIYGNYGNMDIIKQIPEKAKKILDVGCGAGDNARILKTYNKEVTGITISNAEGVIAGKICDEVIVGNIEDEKMNIDKTFDVIILSHVCEHLVYPVITINKLSNNLDRDGIMLIAIPNMAFYKNRFKIVMGDWHMHEWGPFDKTHLHFYSYHSANTLCDTNNVRLIRKLPGQLALPLWPLRKMFPRICEKIDNAFGKYLPNLFAQQIILVLEKMK